MARIEIIQPREQKSHYGLYRTSAGGSQSIFVRRKVGESTDVVHVTSRKLMRLRERLALASQHYSHLTPSQKAITRHEFEEIPFIRPHGLSDTKLLSGRQLFIAREIHSLETTGKQLVLPHEVCITLTDYGLYPIDGEIWLRYLKDGEWIDAKKEKIAGSNWLFSQVPRGQEAYRVYGEAPGFFDPRLEENQFMTEDYLRTHHYHRLYASAPHWHYSFSCGYWVLSHKTTPYTSHSTLHIHSKLKTYGYIGSVIIALWRLPYPYPPEGEIARRTYPISTGSDEYRDYYSTFIGVGFREGVDYWIRHITEPHITFRWYGQIAYYEIP